MTGCCPGGACGPQPLDRRAFLASAAAALAGLREAGAFAGPFPWPAPDQHPIPADKKLDPAWVRSLTERGVETVYRKSDGELQWIGMPIGGVCAGQLYLGGDGTLWHWDVSNGPADGQQNSGQGPHYKDPPRPRSPLLQGFALRVQHQGRSATHRLDASGFPEVEFRGQYPLGRVRYRDPQLPVVVELSACSPFVPTALDDSSLPAVVLEFTVRNETDAPAEVELGGWLENMVCLRSAATRPVVRRNQLVRTPLATLLLCQARSGEDAAGARPAVVFADFEQPTWGDWTTTGTAFGAGPVERKRMPAYQGDVNAQGERLANSHHTRGGEDVAAGDRHLGTLLSPEFTIARHYITFRIGGGRHPGQTCLNLLVDGAPVRTATGHDANRMRLDQFDVREFAGRTARLQIVDGVATSWGNIGVDDIVFSDVPRRDPAELERCTDHGSMALALMAPTPEDAASAHLAPAELPEAAFVASAADRHEGATTAPLLGAVARKTTVKPGDAATWTFVIAWHFANVDGAPLAFLPDAHNLRRHYATRFADAAAVVQHVASNAARLLGATRRWHATWYDSTLPHWLLDRTFANLSTLATATCWRFADGRFYGWEATYCCPGTCTHVWHYAQGPARVFPALERDQRERVDFGLAFHADSGRMDYRAEAGRDVAVDGQAGTILRAYREHLMAPDDAFLGRVWPRVRRALEHLIERDTDQDGILDGAQYNTLDAAWHGAIAWTSSLYLAALRAGAAMALERDDAAFAQRCTALADRGAAAMVARLWNGAWFVHQPDPGHPESNRTGDGVHIDQVFGQSWAWQVGLPRVLPEAQTRSALRALWQYNFAPDVGPYRQALDPLIKGGRWYAMPGEGGLLMCTWPRGGAASAAGKGSDAWAAGYFNECMSGFEYQVAAHMVWEGLVTEGLAVTRAIHDRYHARRRNPWNEVECGDHYARAMASYGVFLAVCGFEYHGPRGHLGFAPRVTPDRFRAAFTAAAGFGSFQQTRDERRLLAEVRVDHGTLRLRSLGLELRGEAPVRTLLARVGEQVLETQVEQVGARITLRFRTWCALTAGQSLRVVLES